MAQDTKLLKRAYAPAKLAMKYHPLYHGKIEIAPKVPVDSYDDFAVWYTPGVADPCKEIQKNPEKVFDLTNKWNNVAIVTDGTRVLGLRHWSRGRTSRDGREKPALQVSWRS